MKRKSSIHEHLLDHFWELGYVVTFNAQLDEKNLLRPRKVCQVWEKILIERMHGDSSARQQHSQDHFRFFQRMYGRGWILQCTSTTRRQRNALSGATWSIVHFMTGLQFNLFGWSWPPKQGHCMFQALFQESNKWQWHSPMGKYQSVIHTGWLI